MEDESNNRQMRRIELDSDSDFRHIYNQIWNVAKQKIEKHFEESMVEDAELKSRVEELVADACCFFFLFPRYITRENFACFCCTLDLV
jgi:hypothetical protein